MKIGLRGLMSKAVNTEIIFQNLELVICTGLGDNHENYEKHT